MSAGEGSKAKWLRELLDRALEIKIPAMSSEEFERAFGIKLSSAEIPNLTYAEAIVRQLVVKAASGNDKSIQDVLDRLLGKPVQQTETTVKSYSYHDFLIECRDADAAESAPKRVGARPQSVGAPATLTIAPDPAADLI